MKRVLSAVALVLLAIVMTAPTASAHTGLDASTPKDGATLDAPPSEIVLTFNEALLENAVKVVAHVKGEKSNVLDDVAEASGKTVKVPWPQDLAGATYEVAYRIVSADGHPVTGTISFSYESPAPSASPSPNPDSSSADATPSTQEAVPLETVTASPTATSAEASTESSSNASPLPVIIIGLAIGIVIGLVIFFVAKKRS